MNLQLNQQDRRSSVVDLFTVTTSLQSRGFSPNDDVYVDLLRDFAAFSRLFRRVHTAPMFLFFPLASSSFSIHSARVFFISDKREYFIVIFLKLFQRKPDYLWGSCFSFFQRATVSLSRSIFISRAHVKAEVGLEWTKNEQLRVAMDNANMKNTEMPQEKQSRVLFRPRDFH